MGCGSQVVTAGTCNQGRVILKNTYLNKVWICKRPGEHSLPFRGLHLASCSSPLSRTSLSACPLSAQPATTSVPELPAATAASTGGANCVPDAVLLHRRRLSHRKEMVKEVRSGLREAKLPAYSHTASKWVKTSIHVFLEKAALY